MIPGSPRLPTHSSGCWLLGGGAKNTAKEGEHLTGPVLEGLAHWAVPRPVALRLGQPAPCRRAAACCACHSSNHRPPQRGGQPRALTSQFHKRDKLHYCHHCNTAGAVMEASPKTTDFQPSAKRNRHPPTHQDPSGWGPAHSSQPPPQPPGRCTASSSRRVCAATARSSPPTAATHPAWACVARPSRQPRSSPARAARSACREAGGGSEPGSRMGGGRVTAYHTVSHLTRRDVLERIW